MADESASILDAGRLEIKIAELKRQLEEKTRELEQEGLRAQDAEERAAALAGQVKELEERAGVFQREAGTAAAARSELEQTLKTAEQARVKLIEVLDRQSPELERWRKEGKEQRARADALEKKLTAAQSSLDDLEKLTGDLRRTAAERERQAAEAAQALKSAEEVRREGIEALEKARELQRKKG